MPEYPIVKLEEYIYLIREQVRTINGNNMPVAGCLDFIY